MLKLKPDNNHKDPKLISMLLWNQDQILCVQSVSVLTSASSKDQKVFAMSKKRAAHKKITGAELKARRVTPDPASEDPRSVLSRIRLSMRRATSGTSAGTS